MKFLNSNETVWRVLRTIVQAVIGVIIANLDMLISAINIGEVWKPVIVALVMAVLSPIMSEIGKSIENKEIRRIDALNEATEPVKEEPKKETSKNDEVFPC